MKKLLRLYYSIALFLLPFAFIHAQTLIPGFTNYGPVTPGISSLTVIKTYQDHRGLIWFATSNGANFFNGKTIQNFRYDALNANSPPADVVTAIQQDAKNRYWFACIGGIGIYDPSAPKGKEFNNIRKKEENKPGLPGDQIQFLAYDGQGHMWASTLSVGLMKIDETTLEAEVVDLKVPENEKVTDGIGIMYDAKEGKIYQAANVNKLISVDVKTGEIINYKTEIDKIIDSQKHELPVDFRVSNVFRDSEGTFWMTTRGNDLIAWNAAKNYGEVWRFGLVRESSDRIFPIGEDMNGNIWFGFPMKGLFILDKKNGKVTNYLNQKDDDSSLAHNSVNHIFRDDKGVMWLATYKGVSKYDPAEQIFSYKRPFQGLDPTLNAPPIASYLEDDKGNEWIGTENGLIFYPKGSESFRSIPVKGAVENNLVIRAIAQASPDKVLLGTGIGLYSFSIPTEKTEPVLWKDCELCNTKVQGEIAKFFPDTIKGIPHVWIGSRKNGLLLLNLPDFTLNAAPIKTDSTGGLPDYIVWDIEKSPDGKMWVSTREGIFQITNTQPWTFTPPPGSAQDTMHYFQSEVRDFCFDKRGNIYAVTQKGLVIQKEDKLIHSLNFFTGINPSAYNVIRDINGGIWMLTSSEYIRYNPDSGEYSFYESRVASRGQYGFGWFVTKKNGDLIYRNTRQVNIIEREKIKKISSPPKTFITDFLLFDTSRTEYLTQTNFKLAPDENNITIFFASDQYTFNMLTQFQWMLEGIDKDWVTVRNRNFALYSALPPGKYLFKVRAKNADNVWDEKGAALAFTILPPWYQTWWFRTFYIGLAAVLLWWLARQNTLRRLVAQRAEIEKQQALERQRERIARDMHDDLGSGLSAIHLLSNYAKDKAGDPEIRREMEKIASSSSQLNQNIREIIWTVNAADDNLASLVHFLRRYCADFQENTGKEITFDMPLEIPEATVSGEIRRNLFLCVKEALNNAVKYSNGAKVEVQVRTAQSGISIFVRDSGQGFDVEEAIQNGGNGLRNMQQRMSEIGGEAIFDSKPGKTEIHFKLNWKSAN